MCLLSQNTLPDLGICTHLYILKCRCVFFACMMQLTETFIDFYTGRGSQVVGGFPGRCYDNPVSVPCTSWQPEGLLCRARVRHTHAHKHTHKYIPTLPTVDCHSPSVDIVSCHFTSNFVLESGEKPFPDLRLSFESCLDESLLSTALILNSFVKIAMSDTRSWIILSLIRTTHNTDFNFCL